MTGADTETDDLGRQAGGLNVDSRQRFLRTMRFEQVDRVPFTEFLGFDPATINRWTREGLPSGDAAQLLGLEQPQMLPVDLECRPPFEEEILEESDTWIVRRTKTGRIERSFRNGGYTIPEVLSYPVKTPKDWNEYRRRLVISDSRLPNLSWYAVRDYPLYLYMRGGLYGQPRLIMGDEALLYAFYDYPHMLHDMLDYWTDFVIACWTPVLQTIEVDFAVIWEDMSYRNGSLISPRMFREFLLPYLKKMTSFLRGYGIDIILVDTDGDCYELIPLFLEGGVTGFFPFEVKSGMDVLAIRRQYPTLQMVGGIDKHKLESDKGTIEREVMSKVPEMVRLGGYIPSLDHAVHPSISLENYRHYLSVLMRAIAP